MNEILRKRLRDALDAAFDAIEFMGNRSLEEFEQNKQLGFAVSYALIIVGEALNAANEQLGDLALVEAIPELRAIISTRNRIVHGYDDVDDAIVWSIVDDGLPKLIAQIEHLLNSS